MHPDISTVAAVDGIVLPTSRPVVRINANPTFPARNLLGASSCDKQLDVHKYCGHPQDG